MAKDFDLTSPKWLDIIFEKRNRQYGAYELRNDSSNRHIKSLIIVIIIGLLAIFLPRIIDNMHFGQDGVIQATGVDITDFVNPDKVDDTQPVEEVVVPPPTLKAAVQFTEAVIDKDENIQHENLIKAQDELNKMDEEIAARTVEGATDGTGQHADDVIAHDAIAPPPPPVLLYAEKMPEFPGGRAALTKWLSDNIIYPQQAIDAGLQGQAVVNFVVSPDGLIDRVKIVKSAHASLDREAIRLVKAMPKWIPGRQNGNAVYVYFNLPINFTLK
ncbi:MAG: TonB family protein [Prevotellaceae bacterium]|jgi:protein TonB|nr:TonB family protein [Prevotellaceae bacterium]